MNKLQLTPVLTLDGTTDIACVSICPVCGFHNRILWSALRSYGTGVVGSCKHYLGVTHVGPNVVEAHYEDEPQQPFEKSYQTVDDECEDCGHPLRYHGKEGCEYERDVFLSGLNSDGLVACRCSCASFKHTYEPLEAKLEEWYQRIQNWKCDVPSVQ